MAYRAKRLKTTWKCNGVNKLVRNNPTLKQAINQDVSVQQIVGDMAQILTGIGATYSVTPASMGFDVTNLTQSAFPIPQMVWMGQLGFDSYGAKATGYKPIHRKEFAAKAKQLRLRVARMIASFRLLADAFDADVKGNPGGIVGG